MFLNKSKSAPWKMPAEYNTNDNFEDFSEEQVNTYEDNDSDEEV